MAMEAGAEQPPIPVQGGGCVKEEDGLAAVFSDLVGGSAVAERSSSEGNEREKTGAVIKREVEVPEDLLAEIEDDREEGELEEDMAQKIRENDPSDRKENGNEKQDEEDDDASDEGEEEEEDGIGETMEDSEPYSSGKEESSSDDGEDVNWTASLAQQLGGDRNKSFNDDSDDEEDKLPRTKNEISSLPPVPKVEVQLQPHHTLVSIGTISSVVEAMIVVEGDANHQALDEGSILWLAETRSPLGFVDEVFGPVKKPFYVVRLNDSSEIPDRARVSARVAFVPDFARTVLKNENLFKKGYDTSGKNDEELSENEVEFSDDEKEAEYKREKARAKRPSRDGSNASSQSFRDRKQPPPPRSRNSNKFGGGGAPRKDDHPNGSLNPAAASFGDEQENELRRLIYESQRKNAPLFGDTANPLDQTRNPQNRNSWNQNQERTRNNSISQAEIQLQNQIWQPIQQQQQQQIQQPDQNFHSQNMAMRYQSPLTAMPPAFWPGQPSMPYPMQPIQYPAMQPRMYPPSGHYFGGFPTQQPVGLMMPGPNGFVPALGWWPSGSQPNQTPSLQEHQVMEDIDEEDYLS